MLNAFRHQRSVHGRDPGYLRPKEMCSTPFGIKDLFTMVGGLERNSLITCSTPFGIKDLFTGTTGTIPCPSTWCSTPFGIKDLFTERDQLARECLRACSTPFGIKDLFTAGSNKKRTGCACAQRLSASKICSRFPIHLWGHIVSGAQRLSASKICSRAQDQAVIKRWAGAQRLSASKICSQKCLATDKVNQECSTPFGIKDLFTLFTNGRERKGNVLNAFRHQRSVHFPDGEGLIGGTKCSTPFGIKDLFTLAGKITRQFTTVLNAFRHQRSVHV